MREEDEVRVEPVFVHIGRFHPALNVIIRENLFFYELTFTRETLPHHPV